MGPVRALIAVLAIAGCNADWVGLENGARPSGEARPVVVFLAETTTASLPAEEAAAWRWLHDRGDFDARYLQIVDLATARLPAGAVLWWHHAQDSGLPSAAVRDGTLNAVRRHVRNGGGILLTLLAAAYTVPLGLEAEPPETIGRVSAALPEAEFGGLQSRLGHPLLGAFWGGVLTARARPGAPQAGAVYRGDRWPLGGNVWAVHKDERDVHASYKIGVEYGADANPLAGTVLTIGAHCYFADAVNTNRAQLEKLVVDALAYVAAAPRPPSTGPTIVPIADQPAGPLAAPAPGLDSATRYWTPSGDLVVAKEIVPSSISMPTGAGSVLNAVAGARSGPELNSYPEDRDLPYTLAGRRAVAEASQLGRIDAFRVHPFRVLRNLRFAIVRPQRGVTWLDEGSGQRTFIARPEGAELRYNDGDVQVSLYLATARQDGGIAAVLAVRSPAAVDVIAAWDIDMSASWPRDRPLHEPLSLGWDAGTHAAVWSDAAGRFAAMAGFGTPDALEIRGYQPAIHLSDLGLTPTPAVAADPETPVPPYPTRSVATQVRVEPGRPALLPFVAVAGSAETVAASFAALLGDPGRAWSDNADYYRNFLDSRTLRLLVPDKNVEDAFKWAKIGADALQVHAPELGGAAFGGYGPAAGVGGWMADTNTFGGDALWLAMAADAYGDRALAADTLRLAARYQRLDGRIPTTVSPAWQMSYDRLADTPLFLIALENHVRTWGDTDLLEQLWPRVVAALEHAFAADRDGDGLIDADGKLDRWNADGQVATTIHLAALWGAALEASAQMASWRGDAALATRAGDHAATVRAILNEQYWDPLGRKFYFGKRRDGSFIDARTVLPAVPMMFRLLEGGIANAALDALAGAGLTTDWGVALYRTPPPEPAADPVAGLSDPPGLPATLEYVSPLFTGWAALAEYDNHRADSGYSHAAANLRLLAHNNLGRAPEMLDPDRFAIVGRSAHAAAAQAMTILPITRGMLGLRPDAIEGTVTIAPHLPGGWGRVNIAPIRIGSNEFRVRIRRTPTGTQFEVERVRGDRAVLFRLSAHVPSDVPVAVDPEITGATIEEEEKIEEWSTDHSSTVGVRLTGRSATIAFKHGAYPQLVPPTANLQLGASPSDVLQPGGRSQGLRIVRARYLGGTMSLELQGLPGKRYTLRLATPFPVARATGVPDVTFANPEPGGATLDVLIPGSGTAYRPIDLEVSFNR